MRLGEGQTGQHVSHRIDNEGGNPGDSGSKLVGDLTPMSSRRPRHPRGISDVHKGRDDSTLAVAGMDHGVVNEVDAAPLPGGAENLADSRLEALMDAANRQLDAPQASARQLA